MAYLNLTPWHQLVKGGLPKFVVTRPMVWDDKELESGSAYPGTDTNLTRMLYQQNRITVAPIQEDPPTKKSPKKGR